MSALIDEMIGAAPYELPGIVSRELKLVSSPSFFMAIASKADKTKSAKAKEKLSNLATTVMNTLEVIVQRTEEKGDVAGQTLQSIISLAAEDDGEFLVPLSTEKSAAMRGAAAERLQEMDDAFLSTVNAWMRKCSDDGLSGMVTILQMVLQQWAALTLSTDKSIQPESEVATASELLDKILATDATAWGAVISHELARSDAVCSKDSLVAEVQKRIETIVLSAGAGSYSQRVQAEFLRELTTRIEEAAAGSGGSATKVVVEE